MASKPPVKPGPKGIPAPRPKLAAEPVAAARLADQDTPPATDSKDARGAALRLRELVSRVTETTGGKKKGVKDIVEATLSALGDALAKGQELNLPGVGKVRVAKSVDREGRSMMTLKVRSAGTPKSKQPKEALAEAGEAV
ncbi:HU family DNA-binding protein [Pseudotabrizicola formosa]|uniref:HU family DNA-binding protein n=1 Tax=Pseudotabrizicola formosa TaxID=2030009 RepID=UPI000CD271BB|nr:HU family DNA-binding protein [Pseudotabrizicola formosa]